MKKVSFLYLLIILTMASCQIENSVSDKASQIKAKAIQAVNENALLDRNQTIAITGGIIIDGTENPPLHDGVIIIKGNKIEAVGKASGISIPKDAVVFDATGMSVLPGLMDAHFHLDNNGKLPNQILKNGVTSLRDPGAWMEAYTNEQQAGYALPRLFLTGPHLDSYPPAYPKNSYILQDREEAKTFVTYLANQGASAIKVYFRLSLGLIEEVCTTARQFGLPVTAHLEITDAKDAISVGLDGIEHVTSFGTSLMPKREAEQYRQAILADNNVRRDGRYQVWSNLDLNHPRVSRLIDFLVEKQTFVCPTLGAFEYQISEDKKDSLKLQAFNNMLQFIGKAYQAGVNIVAGSHGWIPYADYAWAYQHEMELMAACGMSNADILKAATIQNARFFRVDDRLGSIEKTKLADLLLVEGNPLKDLSAMRRVRKVMLNGNWVEEE